MLAAEEELDSNIEYLESVLASGRAPDKVAILGETFKKGDLFRYGNEIRRATKPFTMSQVFQNPNVLSQVSELSGGVYEAQKISEEDKKKISALLESAKQTRERFNNYQLGLDDSDILNSQPQVDEYGTPLTYRHWLLNINERLAAEGPAKADVPFGGFHKSQRPKTNSKSLEDPIYTGNRFNLEEREIALAKAKKNLANGNPTPEDLQLLADEAYENQKVTSQVHGITNRDSTMSGQLAGQLAAEVAKKNDNSELNNSPLEVQRELLSNPALDRQFNLALYLRRMVLRGDQRLPESMRTITITDQNGESRIVELDEILGNPEYEAIWKSQNESLKNFNFHYDNLSEKSDPLNSLSSDDSNEVKEYFAKDEERKGKAYERNVATRLTSADIKVLKANLSLIEDKELRSEIRSLLNSSKDIVLDMGDTTTSVDKLPKYFDLNIDGRRGNIFDSDVGDKMSVPSEDSKKPYAVVEVLKIPEDTEQFNRDFAVAKASNNLLDFLVKNKIVKEVERLESMPIDVIEASHQEVADLIKGEREKLSEVQDMIDSFESMTLMGAETRRQGPTDNTALDALYKARDELEKSIREAEKDVQSGGRTGGFNIDGYRLSMASGKLGGNPVLTAQTKGRWSQQDKRAKNKTPQRFSTNLKKDDQIQAFFNNVFLERALSEKITVQDEFDPGIHQENLSSFIVTPRKLAQFVHDMGIKNINQLSGSYSRYKAESRGGIELLRFVPGVLEEMLNDLESVNVEKIKRVEALKKAYAGTRQEAVIERHLNRLYQQEATFKGYSMADRVMLQHMAEVKQKNTKSYTPPKEFSKEDINFGKSLAKEGTGKAFSVAVDSVAPKYTKPTVVHLGQVEVEGKDGNKYKKNVRAIVTPANQSKTGFVEKQSKQDYEASKKGSIEETGSLTTKDLQTVKGTNQIPLKGVGNRWPGSPGLGQDSGPVQKRMTDAIAQSIHQLESIYLKNR